MTQIYSKKPEDISFEDRKVSSETKTTPSKSPLLDKQKEAELLIPLDDGDFGAF